MKKLILFLLIMSFSKLIRAQETPNINMVFNHVALSVKDVNSSADFYHKVLNLSEIANRTKVDGIIWLSLGEGKELHLVSILKGDIIINKAVHFALTTTTFDDFVTNLERMNIPYSSWLGEENKITIRADGIKQIYLQDPDGYWIEVNSVGQM
jgi:catechol 2,3-dioxygenase-like lactoylglutathione lyase family enzyme